MAIRGILFDNDGTLVDTHDVILLSMRYTTRKLLGREFTDDQLMAKVGIPLDAQMMDFAEGDEELRDELLRVYRAHNHEHHDGMISLFPGVADGLRELSERGIALGVVTAKRHALAQHGLEVMGIWPYLGFLIGADDCPRAKPSPDPILMGAAQMGLAPEECIYLGDSPFDMQASNSAGTTTAAALWGMFPREVLLAERPARTCESFPEFTTYALGQAERG